MKVNSKLLSKNGLATLHIAKEFLGYPIGSKVPTVTELESRLKLARGTIQSALKLLQEEKAIQLEKKGHLGSYLIKKNTHILLGFAGITSLIGAMPLPYSKKYEGLASGLVTAMENSYNLPVNLAYMRGSRNRIGMVLSNRCDFAIVSKYAAEAFLKTSKTISIVKDLGPYSYLSEHVVIFHDPKATTIKNGMLIGIDNDSIDQKKLTEAVCKGKKVKYVPIEYSSILNHVTDGSVDAAVWNKDEITDKLLRINYSSIKDIGSDSTEAVIICNADSKEIISLLNEVVNVDVVLNIQKLVIEGKITPSY